MALVVFVKRNIISAATISQDAGPLFITLSALYRL